MIVNDVSQAVPVGSLAALAVCTLLLVAACEVPPPTALQQQNEESADVVAPVQEAVAEGAARAIIRLSGSALAGDETPLIYVNRVRIGHALPDLDPESIERIEVLKGEAARAIFGDEAAGGVIQIFLKLGVAQSDDERLRRTKTAAALKKPPPSLRLY